MSCCQKDTPKDCFSGDFAHWEHFLKDLLQKGDYTTKLDMKDAYFLVSLHQESQEKARFKWKGKIYKFLCMCFGLGLAPRVFTKLLKVLIALTRRLNDY